MGDSIFLNANKRDVAATKPKAIRAEGQVPAVVHDHGKDSHHIVVDHAELKRVYAMAGKHAPVDIDVDGKKYTTLIKEVTYKPATSMVYHTVFQAVKANETVTAEIPLKLTEDIPAEKASLMVVIGVDVVEVEALPRDLVDFIEVDASGLVEVGDKITVADVKAPAGITIKTDEEQMVAVVEMPKDQIAEADAAAAELAADAGVPDEEESAGEGGDGEATSDSEAKE